MFSSIKEFLREQFTGGGAAASPLSLALAAAALLVEVARADERIEPAERTAMARALGPALGLPEDAVARLVAEAESAVERSVSLFEFTSVLNAGLEPARKLELVANLWRVAAADGRVDHYEEYYIRKIADLLHVSHGDLIRCKLRALDGA
ncbi:MAG: TerB family tellurite resistance protein [Gammaproteobacteria bacterium]|nr:TerB family tellurite resistance protein [Gammaproteobacteria bacterium]MBI5618930.1 TerB family tellurite resistance protein [Gammaproteobacteria bacterium]